MELADWFERLGPRATNNSGETVANHETDFPVGPDSMLLSVAKPAMACEFEVLLNQHQYPQGADRALEALELVEQIERLFSVYKPRSELSTLNRFGFQRSVSLSEDSIALLRLAHDLSQVTDGAFDITAGTLSEIWGFSRREGAVPTPTQIAAALECVGIKYLKLDGENRSAQLLREGVCVNPGGIGKGYALDRASKLLASADIADFMIHGGLSSVVARGHRQHANTGGGWLVALKHPWRLEETLGTIRLCDQALGTSGSGKQFFHFGGKRYSHIIDPRSGYPAQGMMSATVICPSGAVADALATALFVLGPAKAQEFCDEHPSISAILVYADSKSGRVCIRTCNVPEGMWQPLARTS